jgi:phage gp16-like protein
MTVIEHCTPKMVWKAMAPHSDYYQGAVARAEKAEAELAKVEAVLVAADRVREAYDAMLDGRALGRLPDFGGQ